MVRGFVRGEQGLAMKNDGALYSSAISVLRARHMVIRHLPERVARRMGACYLLERVTLHGTTSRGGCMYRRPYRILLVGV